MVVFQARIGNTKFSFKQTRARQSYKDYSFFTLYFLIKISIALFRNVSKSLSAWVYKLIILMI